MPIYEFLCQECHTKSSILVKNIAESFVTQCPECGSNDLVRVVSRFAYRKSTKTVREEAGEPPMLPSPDYYKDPRNIGRWTEKRFKEMGLEMPAEVQQEIQAAREGELPPSLKEQL
jgi:putative FmdB family regulatory protein